MVERQLWKSTFRKYDVLRWPCPTCKDGNLYVDNASLAFAQTADSVAAGNHPDWEPEWIQGRFSSLLRCNRCNEVVAVAGRYIADYFETEDNALEIFERYEPLFFSDAPDIFTLPKLVPELIATEIRKAFHLYWTDAAASANRIRSSIEMLLSHMGIKRFSISRGKRHLIALHSRIELLKVKRPELAERLLAIKWLGNAGSHSSSIDKDDLLDAFEILDYVLEDMFVQRHKRISKMVQQINRAKGPRAKL